MSSLQLQLHCDGANGFQLQLDCRLPAQGVTALCGPSGSGKTTLLDCIAGLRQPRPGASIIFRDERWLVDNTVVPPWLRGVGYVFSDARLFPHLNVRNNLQYALNRRLRATGPSLDDVVAWLELDALLERQPQTLSAGQCQRAAIARALAAAPQLLLLDEPLANLDDSASDSCLRCLQRLTSELNLPMLYVSHDVEEVAQLADHLLLLDSGQAVDQGPFIERCNQLDSRLCRDEGAAAIVHARVAGHDTDFGLTELALPCGERLLVSELPLGVGSARRVRVPARDVSLCRQRPQDSSILNILPVTVDAIEQGTGARLMLRLALGDQFLLARVTRKSVTQLALQPGDRVFAQIKSAALLMDGEDPQ